MQAREIDDLARQIGVRGHDSVETAIGGHDRPLLLNRKREGRLTATLASTTKPVM